MGVLSKQEIISRLENGQLITNPAKDGNGSFNVEHASYDLRAGIAIWKNDSQEVQKKSDPGKRVYNPDLELAHQPIVTLQPGQMMFVITHEQIYMPIDLCGTVYSRNNLSRAGILALNAGHIDPGFKGNIVIRLINLRSIPYKLILGKPIYTIVFHKLEYKDAELLTTHEEIPLEKTIEKVLESANCALSNALYDLTLLHEFVKKEEFGEQYLKWLKSSFLGIITIVLAIIGAIVTIITFCDATGIMNFFRGIGK